MSRVVTPKQLDGRDNGIGGLTVLLIMKFYISNLYEHESSMFARLSSRPICLSIRRRIMMFSERRPQRSEAKTNNCCDTVVG